MSIIIFFIDYIFLVRHWQESFGEQASTIQQSQPHSHCFGQTSRILDVLILHQWEEYAENRRVIRMDIF